MDSEALRLLGFTGKVSPKKICACLFVFWFIFAAADSGFSPERRRVLFSARAGMWCGQVEMSLSRVKTATAEAAKIYEDFSLSELL